MTINIPLLTKVMTHIRRNPEQHDQGFWGVQQPHCGTVHCLAGWTAALTGARLKWRTLETLTGTTASYVTLEDGRKQSIPAYAAEKLTLNSAEEGFLFFATNELLWLRVAALTDGKVTREKIDEIIAEQDAARHRKEDEKKTDEETKDTDRTEPERTGKDDTESDGRDNEEPHSAVRELVNA